MAKYKFSQFTGTISNPTVSVVSVHDNISLKTCDVDVKLTTSSAEFGVTLSGFSYANTWEDSEIIAWVNSELAKYTA